jgi:hypothetical protein
MAVGTITQFAGGQLRALAMFCQLSRRDAANFRAFIDLSCVQP